MPHGFDTARNHKNNIKKQNTNKDWRLDDKWSAKWILSSSCRDHTKHGRIRGLKVARHDQRDFKTETQGL